MFLICSHSFFLKISIHIRITWTHMDPMCFWQQPMVWGDNHGLNLNPCLLALWHHSLAGCPAPESRIRSWWLPAACLTRTPQRQHRAEMKVAPIAKCIFERFTSPTRASLFDPQGHIERTRSLRSDLQSVPSCKGCILSDLSAQTWHRRRRMALKALSPANKSIQWTLDAFIS